MLEKRYKQEFSVFEQERNLVYLDSAASTLRPRMVSDVLYEFASFQHANIHRGAYKLSYEATQRYDEVREKVVRFIHAKSPEEIIFTYGATDGINLLFRSFADFEADLVKDQIVVSIFEHHSNLVPWQQLCMKQDLSLNYLYDFSDEALEVINERTKIVAVTLTSNATGFMPPIEKVIRKAHEFGALVVCDAAQYIGHAPLDVQALDIDFLVFSGHKMFAPTGIGVLYGKKELLSLLTPYRFGGDMIEYVTEQATTFAPLPNRFEAGTPNIEGVIGLGAAIDFIERIGIESINEHVSQLRKYCMEALNKIDSIEVIEFDENGKRIMESSAKDIGTKAHLGPVIAFTIADVHPHDASSILDTANIAIRAGHHCAQPLMKYLGVPATCRVSFQIYNTFEDIDCFINEVKKVRRWLGYGA